MNEAENGAEKPAEASESVRIRRGQLESLRRLNRILFDAGAGRPSERRDGIAIAMRELVATCVRLQNPTARVILQAQLDELEGRLTSQRAILGQVSDMAARHETAAKEATRRVMATEARNRELRTEIDILCNWLAVAVGGDMDAVAKRTLKAVTARTNAAAVAAAEGRTLTPATEEKFVRNLLPEGCGEEIARRAARPFPTEGGGGGGGYSYPCPTAWGACIGEVPAATPSVPRPVRKIGVRVSNRDWSTLARRKSWYPSPSRVSRQVCR